MDFYQSLCHVNTVRDLYESLTEFLGSNRLGRNPHKTYSVLSMRVTGYCKKQSSLALRSSEIKPLFKDLSLSLCEALGHSFFYGW